MRVKSFYDSVNPANPPRMMLDLGEFGLPMNELQGQKVEFDWRGD